MSANGGHTFIFPFRIPCLLQTGSGSILSGYHNNIWMNKINNKKIEQQPDQSIFIVSLIIIMKPFSIYIIVYILKLSLLENKWKHREL